MSTAMKEATDLENAVQRVAEAGRDASEAATKMDRHGWCIPYEEMKELREAVAEWKKATQDFLWALHASGGEG